MCDCIGWKVALINVLLLSGAALFFLFMSHPPTVETLEERQNKSIELCQLKHPNQDPRICQLEVELK